MSAPHDGIGPELRGRSLLVTGGGTGIGAATARLAAEAGMAVMVTGRRMEPLDRVVGEIRAQGGKAARFVVDVVEEGSSAAMLEATAREFGGVDAVFANAGFGIEKPLLETTPDEIRRIFDVNLIAAVDLMRSAGLLMREAGMPGHLLGCSSILGKFTLPDYGLYSATKAALTHVCRSMRCELAGSGIAVSSVHPVTTTTEFFAVAARESGGGHGPDLRPDGTPAHAPRMFVQPPERVATAVVRCLRRPRAEVWTTFSGRLAAGVFELLPPVYEMMLRGEMGRKAREASAP